MAQYVLNLLSLMCFAAVAALVGIPSVLAAEIDWHREIAQLASTNPPPKITEPTEEPIFAKSFRWEDGEKRIMDKVKYISTHAAEALPFLVAHVGDKEYAVTYESGSGYWSNMTVGDLCCEMIHHAIEVRSDLRPRGSSRAGRELVGYGPEQIQKWWSTRSKRNLKDLQLEWLEFAIKLEREVVPPEKDVKKRISELENAMEKIAKSGEVLPTAYSFRLRQP